MISTTTAWPLPGFAALSMPAAYPDSRPMMDDAGVSGDSASSIGSAKHGDR